MLGVFRFENIKKRYIAFSNDDDDDDDDDDDYE